MARRLMRRFALQQAQVEALDVVFVGRGELGAKNPRRALRRGDLARSFLARAFAWRVARRRGAKLNIQVHADLSGQSLIKHVLAKIVLRHADSIRVVSEHIKHQVEKTGVRAPIRVLPVFIDIERFKNITPVPHDKKTILWIGRFEREKDPLQALAIYKSVLDAEVDAKLVLLGAGSLETDLRAKAAAIGGTCRVSRVAGPAPVSCRGGCCPLHLQARKLRSEHCRSSCGRCRGSCARRRHRARGRGRLLPPGSIWRRRLWSC